MTLPVIIVLDMDFTIIGETLCAYTRVNLGHVLTSANKAGKLSKRYKIKPMTYANTLVQCPNIVRPRFADSIAKIKEAIPTAEFFIYSSGSKAYVEGIIPWVETHTGVQFNRPIFTRDDTVYASNGYVKSIKLWFDTIVATLQPRYRDLRADGAKDAVLKNRTLFIDDNTVLWDDDIAVIKCPAYKYSPFFDIMKGLDDDLVIEPVVQEHLKTVAVSAPVFVKTPDGVQDEEELRYHLFMAENYSKVLHQNTEALKDDFFPKLATALKTVKTLQKPFTKDTMKRINKILI